MIPPFDPNLQIQCNSLHVVPLRQSRAAPCIRGGDRGHGHTSETSSFPHRSHAQTLAVSLYVRLMAPRTRSLKRGSPSCPDDQTSETAKRSRTANTQVPLAPSRPRRQCAAKSIVELNSDESGESEGEGPPEPRCTLPKRSGAARPGPMRPQTCPPAPGPEVGPEDSDDAKPGPDEEPAERPSTDEGGSGCAVCGTSKDEAKLLLCDGCDAEYHMYCLKPKLLKVPSGQWYCDNCQRGKHRGIDSFFKPRTSQDEARPSHVDAEAESNDDGPAGCAVCRYVRVPVPVQAHTGFLEGLEVWLLKESPGPPPTVDCHVLTSNLQPPTVMSGATDADVESLCLPRNREG